MTTLVLLAEGKNTTTDYITIKSFESENEAKLYVNDINGDNKEKYWESATIISTNKQYEIEYEFNPHFE